jgi:hypothetical protein
VLEPRDVPHAEHRQTDRAVRLSLSAKRPADVSVATDRGRSTISALAAHCRCIPGGRVIAILLLFALAQPAAGRMYHRVTIARLASPAPTHVVVDGLVAYRRLMKDGDWHLTLTDREGRKVVVEIIPAIPLEVPRKGARVRVWGISRVDFQHKWAEIHPAERIEVLQ